MKIGIKELIIVILLYIVAKSWSPSATVADYAGLDNSARLLDQWQTVQQALPAPQAEQGVVIDAVYIPQGDPNVGGGAPYDPNVGGGAPYDPNVGGGVTYDPNVGGGAPYDPNVGGGVVYDPNVGGGAPYDPNVGGGVVYDPNVGGGAPYDPNVGGGVAYDPNVGGGAPPPGLEDNPIQSAAIREGTEGTVTGLMDGVKPYPADTSGMGEIVVTDNRRSDDGRLWYGIGRLFPMPGSGKSAQECLREWDNKSTGNAPDGCGIQWEWTEGSK